MQNRRLLVRGAAILLFAGLSAGCSSDLMRFDHGLTASTANRPVSDQQMQAQAAPVYQDRQNQQYQDPQPYPGDDPSRTGNIDLTTTASINRAGGGQPGLRGNSQKYAGRNGVPVPSVNVGATGVANSAPQQPYPQQRSASASQPFPTAPRQTTGQVSRELLPAPGAPGNNVDRTTTGSIQTQPQQVKQPVASREPDRQSSALPSNGPVPTKAPTERVAVLPQQTRAEKSDDRKADKARATTTGAVYTVVAGDTLSGIAGKTGSTADAIKQANGLDSGLIQIGQKLVIPGTTVQGDTASSAPAGVDPIVTGGTSASRSRDGYTPPKPENAEIEKMVEQAAAAPDSTGVGRLRWPVQGRVVSAFGSQSGGKRNDGIDIAVPEGTPVKAAENGVVIYAGDGLKDFGNTVLVRHENGLVTVYGHNSQITVSRGTTVRRGQEIARSGVSGNAGSPKLHFEVRQESAPLDPVKYLE